MTHNLHIPLPVSAKGCSIYSGDGRTEIAWTTRRTPRGASPAVVARMVSEDRALALHITALINHGPALIDAATEIAKVVNGASCGAYDVDDTQEALDGLYVALSPFEETTP